MIIAVSVAALVVALLYILFIRQQDLPYVEPVSPTAYLDERKAAIYENIRDANFEFLMGKLSEQDYQQTKSDLQAELAEVNQEIAQVMKATGVAPTPEPVRGKGKGKPAKVPVSMKAQVAAAKPESVASVVTAPVVCPHCGASFEQEMKFCGECGKPMAEVDA